MAASSDRFIRAVQAHWESDGSASLSARGISILAKAPVSSIYHHFGSLEQLFVTSQQASLARTRDWLDDRLGQFAGFSAGTPAFAAFFAEIVDEWVNAQRSLAFAWRECRLLAEDNVRFQPLSAQWERLWSDFWQTAGDQFALGSGTRIACRVFENESFLHMIRWRRLVDRAVLDETARVLSAWLSRQPVPETPWRAFARTEAQRSMPTLPQRDDTAARIVAAAAELIADAGVTGLTHRAVADRAGLTLGAVSHKFGTKSALLEAGFEGLYVSQVERLHSEMALPACPDRASALTALSGMILRSASGRGRDELFLAVARDPSLSPFGAQLRYLRGRTSMGTLQALVGRARVIMPAEAALFSSFTTSQIRCFSGTDTPLTEYSARSELDSLLNLLA